MSAQDVSTLKGYFNTGDKPTETQFANLIDSFPNLTDGGTFTGAITTASVTKGLVSITATDAITAAEHAGRTLVLNAANAGGTAVTLTLPAATGTGNVYHFVVGIVSAMAGAYKIQVADATDTIDGYIIAGNDDDATLSRHTTAADSDTITLNGTSTGGVGIGDSITLIDIASNQFIVTGTTIHNGSEATPFSVAVS